MGVVLKRVQPFPAGSPLRDQLNLGLMELTEHVGTSYPDRTVYPYVIATVKSRNGVLEQTGGSPNFQGGVVTLCDCKHYLRSFASVCDSGGVWIAGITGPAVSTRHRRYLFYLMYAEPVNSHAELWQRLTPTTRQAKSATRDRLGDLYEPTGELHGDTAFVAQNYRRPIKGHVHGANGAWMRDIEQTYRGRHPCLLVGMPAFSFIWTRPRLSLMERSPLSRNPSSSANVAAFLSRLRNEMTGQ